MSQRNLLILFAAFNMLGLISLSRLPLHGMEVELKFEQTPRPTITSIPKPTITSIPRPTVRPDLNDVKGSSETAKEVGSHIELHITPSNIVYWTEIQWQDISGGWHVVEGWRGSSSRGIVRWFVASKDFNTGPFRWLIYKQKGSNILGTSEVFALPGKANETNFIHILTTSKSELIAE